MQKCVASFFILLYLLMTSEQTQSSKEQTKQRPVRRSSRSTKQKGKPGELWTEAFENNERRVDTLEIADYRRMRDNDGQVQMLLSATYNTILGVGYEILDDPDFIQQQVETEVGMQESEEKQFVEENLTEPRWKNGMSRSMTLTNKTNLRALEEGYRVSEVIYRVDEDGKIRLDQLAPRALKDSDSQLKLKVGKHGDFIGFQQRTSYKGEFIDIIVLNESDILKAINVVFGEEYGSNYGRPALKPIWYHFDKLHKGLYINHVGHELGAIKFRMALTNNTTEEEEAELDTMLERVGMENWTRWPKEKVEIQFLEASDGAVMSVGKEMIDYHTRQMAKAMLAQFIELGVSSQTGARAVSNDMIAFFKGGLQYIGKVLIEDPWNRIISDMIKLNFDREIYPRYKIKPLEDETVESLLNMYTELIKTGRITEGVQTQLLEKGSEKLGLDVSKEGLVQELEQERAREEQESQQKLQNQLDIAQARAQQASNFPIQASEVQLQDEQMTTNIRTLFPDEQKVKLGDIQRRLSDAERRAEASLANKLRLQQDAITDAYVVASRRGRKSIRNVKIELQELPANTYSEELLAIAMEMLDLGKVMSANELNRAVPTSSADDILDLEFDVEDIINKQETDLGFRLRQVANESLRQNIPENETKLRLDEEYRNFFASILAPTLGALIPSSFNKGRNVTIQAYTGDEDNDIWGVRYTAVLDNRTTEFCQALDGSVFQMNDPQRALFEPPNHFNCRSIWTPISNAEAEEFNIRATGKPSSDFPTFSSISTFRDVTDVDDLSEKQIERYILSITE
jgi:hypothetical protein